MYKRLSILGSTGSIGTQALDVVRLNGFTVCALTANSRIDVLEEQILSLIHISEPTRPY